jgi:hypothetical protein
MKYTLMILVLAIYVSANETKKEFSKARISKIEQSIKEHIKNTNWNKNSTMLFRIYDINKNISQEINLTGQQIKDIYNHYKTLERLAEEIQAENENL